MKQSSSVRDTRRSWGVVVVGLIVVLSLTANRASAEHSPPGGVDASCGPDGELVLEEGTRFEVVLHYTGGASDVTFTASMNENDFFGAADTFDSFTVPGNDEPLGVFRRFEINTSGLPATSDQVVIAVTSSATGPTVLATCDFTLTIFSTDADGDGFLDAWETDGIDADGDGVIDLALGEPPFDADPLRKDVYLEIDYMDCAAGGCAVGDTHTHKPETDAIQDVVDAFAGAPVENPDGSTGITLHAMLDEGLQDVVNYAFATPGPGALDDFDDIKLGGAGACDGAFGTVADRTTSNCANLLKAKRQVFRYTLFGHSTSDGPTTSGWSELPGNDLTVTFGMWPAASIDAAGGVRAAHGGTLMHELGHSLGLQHGGGDSINCKPNYLSVMSWSGQLLNFDPTRPLDYSRDRLTSLDETVLNEAAGIGGPTGRRTTYGLDGLPVTVTADASIDWDGDGDATEFPVSNLDINRIDSAGCTASPDQVLAGYDDWDNLLYSFQGFGNFADGVHDIGAGHGDDITSERSLDMAQSSDFDGDAVSNLEDNCVVVANPTQRDIDGDGSGDVCDGENVVGIDIKPGSSDNPIRPASGGTITVAILSSSIFNAPAEIVPGTLTFGRFGDERSFLKCNATSLDVNGDLRPDLICHFRTKQAGFKLGDSEGVLKGSTLEGLAIVGTDAVWIVP